jgi:hypothetical protein
MLRLLPEPVSPAFRNPLPYSINIRDESLFILLLERLGGLIPWAQPLPPTADQDLRDIFDDLAEMGVQQNDVRYHNLLAAPSEPSSLPSLSSPFTKRSYSWRVIDFDIAELSNSAACYIKSYGSQNLIRILANIPGGYTVDPI